MNKKYNNKRVVLKRLKPEKVCIPTDSHRPWYPHKRGVKKTKTNNTKEQKLYDSIDFSAE